MSISSIELTNEVVRAGAGAGKTTYLTQKVVEVARQWSSGSGDFPRIVVTTFTKKATQELKERLMLWALNQRDDELLDFVTSKNKLMITTIHGVLNTFLARYGHLYGLDSSFEVMTENEAILLSRKILRELLAENHRFLTLLETYSLQQVIGICRHYYDQALTYPDLAPHDEKSYQELLQQELRDMSVKTRKVGLDILNELPAEKPHKGWLEFGQMLCRLSQSLEETPIRAIEALQTCLKENRKPQRRGKQPPVSEELDLNVKALWAELKDRANLVCFNPQVWPHFFDSFKQLNPLAQKFSDKFLMEKRLAGKIEMSDLETLALRFIQERPEAGQSFAREWDYWLIDEYQDTSPIQVTLLKALIGGKPHFIVGDPQQSIYLFRGAQKQVFDQAEKEVKNNRGELTRLKRNYRSDPELLLFFNDFFARFHPPFSPMDPNLASGQKVESGRMVAYFADASVPDEESDERDRREKREQGKEEELRAIALHVFHCLESGSRAEDICIIARTNQQLNEISDYLDLHGFANHVHAAAGFYDRREILDALALLKFLVHPLDNQNLIGLLRSPWFRVSDECIVMVTRELSPQQFFWPAFVDRVSQKSSSGNDYWPVDQLISLLESCQKLGITETWLAALTKYGFFDWSHRHDSTGRREANLWKLVTDLTKKQKKAGFNFLSFIEQAEVAWTSMASAESDAVAALESQRIHLMTVHGSKGLQFKHVLVPFIHKGPLQTTAKDVELFVDKDSRRWSVPVLLEDERGEPKMTAGIDGWLWIQKRKSDEIEESLRLLYVALTRAKNSVFISWHDKAAKNSWLELMNWNLEKGLHQTKHYSYRVDYGPFEEVQLTKEDKRHRAAPRAPYEEQALLIEKREDDPIYPQATGTSVTSMVKAITKDEMSSHQLLSMVKASERGRVIHQIMEMAKFQRPDSFEPLIEQWFQGEEEREGARQAVRYVFSLTEPPVKQLVEDGFVEWGFSTKIGDDLVRGQIDLWGECRGTVWVVDYKTGSLRGKENAFAQLKLYAKALLSGPLAQMKSVKIQLAAIFVLDEKVFCQTYEEG